MRTLGIVKLTTSVHCPASPTPLELGTNVLCLGSCFAERVGGLLGEHLFPTHINPCGIAYSPVHLARHLSSERPYPSLFLHESRWRSFSLHSDLSDRSIEKTRELIEQAHMRLDQALESSRLLLLTLGTATVHELALSGEIVANCHRLPQSLFSRRRLSLEQCLQALHPPLSRWLEHDPQRRLIVSVSPIRYLRQGLVENARSKAVLLLTAETLTQTLPRSEYFPAFEILTDELRDYRFYDDDMAQPSRTALKIVWERFGDTFFSDSDKKTLALATQLYALRKHRPTTYTDLAKLRAKSEELTQLILAQSPHLSLNEPLLPSDLV